MPKVIVRACGVEHAFNHPKDVDEYTFWRNLATITTYDENDNPKNEWHVSINRKGHVFLSKQDNGPKK